MHGSPRPAWPVSARFALGRSAPAGKSSDFPALWRRRESNPRKISIGSASAPSAGRCRIIPSERKVDRVLERQRSPCRKLGRKPLGPERSLEPRQRLLLERVVLIFVGSTETRRQFLHSAE